MGQNTIFGNDNKIRLKRTHKYYTEVIGQMVLTGCRQTYFVVWTTKSAPFIEKIDFDNAYWNKVLANLIVIFKSYIHSYLLKLKHIFSCPIHSKPCLDENEYDATDENSKQCDLCTMWYQ